MCQELLYFLRGELAYPPPAGLRAWEWFWELERSRQVGMEVNAISWNDIAAWQQVTGARPELWELSAIYRMGIYRVNPDYDPRPVKPVSFLQSLKALQDAHKSVPESEYG